EVREIQRRSRIDSGGLVTISSELAGAVARGDLSLDEAIARSRRPERRSKRQFVPRLELLAAFEVHLLRNLSGRELSLERLECPSEVGLEGDRVFLHNALQEVEE